MYVLYFVSVVEMDLFTGRNQLYLKEKHKKTVKDIILPQVLFIIYMLHLGGKFVSCARDLWRGIQPM